MRSQVPQFDGSLRRSTSQPSPADELQFAKPGSQEAMLHAPAAHVAVAFAVLQGAQPVSEQPKSGSLTSTHVSSHAFLPSAQVPPAPPAPPVTEPALPPEPPPPLLPAAPPEPSADASAAPALPPPPGPPSPFSV